MVTLIFILEL